VAGRRFPRRERYQERERRRGRQARFRVAPGALGGDLRGNRSEEKSANNVSLLGDDQLIMCRSLVAPSSAATVDGERPRPLHCGDPPLRAARALPTACRRRTASPWHASTATWIWHSYQRLPSPCDRWTESAAIADIRQRVKPRVRYRNARLGAAPRHGFVVELHGAITLGRRRSPLLPGARRSDARHRPARLPAWEAGAAASGSSCPSARAHDER
jgi:hypothetical protein